MYTREEAWLLKEKYSGVVSTEFAADRKALAAGTPLAYLIGHIPFLGTTIYLDSHPLIPRAETEFWVEVAIRMIEAGLQSVAHQGLETESFGREWRDDAPEHLKILDLCAGSGCIGVAVAHAVPNAHITFAEIDPAHAATIKKNCLLNGIPEHRFSIVTTNLFDDITDTFDYILSNPPYIDPALDRTEPSVKQHEPHIALYGGHEGLELIEKIIAHAPKHLMPGGQLWIEHEPEQSEIIKIQCKKYGFIITSHPDQFEQVRYSILMLK